MRLFIRQTLAAAGFLLVVEAEDGSAGLKLIESSAAIALLIIDIGLEGRMNGRQVAEAARAICPDLKILLVSGEPDSPATRDVPLERGMLVIAKPFDRKTLVRMVIGLLAN